MMGDAKLSRLSVAGWKCFLAVAICLLTSSPAWAADAGNPAVEQLLDRTGNFVVKFLEVFSNVKCTELVSQSKLGKGGKVEYGEDSTYDYLVLTQSPGGELTLVESRLAGKQPRHTRNLPLLVTNGFSTLLLVFHPSYQASFEFTALENEVLDGKLYARVRFRHVPGTRSTAVLLLRGREYPLDLEGLAWFDPQSGAIAKISAGLETSMEDVGLRALQCEVEYGPVSFPSIRQTYWLPTSARVDVETPRQHWRNLHRFTAYQRFSTSTESRIGENR